MMPLYELQREMRRGVLGQESERFSQFIIADAIPAADRLRTYRNNIRGAIVKALRLTYPVIDRLVGTEFFDATAVAFHAATPPGSACLDDYGGDFAEFLETYPPAKPLPYLADVARLEWAIGQAAQAPRTAPLNLALLASVDETDHARLRFQPHPSLRLLRLSYPADEIWRAIVGDNEGALGGIDVSPARIGIVVHRGNDEIELHRMPEPEWLLLAKLCSGVPLEAALTPEFQAIGAGLLATCLERGLFGEFTLGEVEADYGGWS